MTTAAATTPGYQVAELAGLVGVRPDVQASVGSHPTATASLTRHNAGTVRTDASSGRVAHVSMKNSSNWMLSGSRNTSTEYFTGSVASFTLVGNAEVVQPCRPGVKVRTGRDGDGNVIQTGTPLVARLPTVRNVVVQPDHHPGRRIGQHDRVAGLLIAEVREARRNPLQPQHPLVPRRTRLDVGDGR